MEEEEDEIISNIKLLKEIESSIDNCDNSLNKIVQNRIFPDNVNNSEPKNRAYYNWACAYGIYTSYHLYLMLSGTKPKDHPISKELKRLQEFRDKIRIAEGAIPPPIEKSKNNKGKSRVDKKAAENYIQNVLGKKRKKE